MSFSILAEFEATYFLFIVILTMFGNKSNVLEGLFTYLKRLFGKTAIRSLENLEGWDRTDAALQNLIATAKVPGMAVTIQKEGEIVLQKGYGHAHLEDKVPVDPEHSLFRIASISKCITGVALAKMVEDGFLDLDDSFYKYVPDYPLKKYDFTLRQLAGHKAGLRGYRGKEYALNQSLSIQDSIEVFKNDPLKFRPGSGYLYNSFDFVLLSLAMQEASGVPFQEYVKANVLVPLGMHRTFSPEEVQHASDGALATFYTKTLGYFKQAMLVNNNYKLAGGGYLSTSSDIAKLGQAVLDKKILKPELWKQVLSSQYVIKKPTYYGLGFQVSQDSLGRSFVGHVGNSVGAYSNFFTYPKEQLVIVALINCTDPKVQNELNSAFF